MNGSRPWPPRIAGRAPCLHLPAWRRLLESRWEQRLETVIRLSVAYHDTADRSGGEPGGDRAVARQLDQLLQQAVAARRSLSETEAALDRLAGGGYGRCEQCGTAIHVTRLAVEPETRYCQRCAREGPGEPGAVTAAAGRR